MDLLTSVMSVIVFVICVLVISIVSKVCSKPDTQFTGAYQPPAFFSKEFVDRKKQVSDILPNGMGLSSWHHLLVDYMFTSQYTRVMPMYNLFWEALNISNTDTSKNMPIINIKDLPSDPPYTQESGLARFGLHIGQRKLFLNELYFVSRRVPAADKAVIVYAGAAPANKGALLASMTPNITWIFVDPADFNIFSKDFPKITQQYLYPKPGTADNRNVLSLPKEIAFRCVREAYDSPKNINIINSYMNDTIAQAFLQIYGAGGVYFISDIRTNFPMEGLKKRYPDTADITLNNVWQFNWLRVMKPKYAMLKFRMPFFMEDGEVFDRFLDMFKSDFDKAKSELNGVPGVDFESLTRQKKIYYFRGDIILQPWAPRSSTETRLETDCTSMTDYNCDTYDTNMFLYNVVYRNVRYTTNANADPGIGFDHCNDCAFENIVWTNWLETYRKHIGVSNGDLPNTVQKCVKMLIAAVGGRSFLIRDQRMPEFLYHGGLDAPLTQEKFQKMLEYYKLTHDKPHHNKDSFDMFNSRDDS